jgi:hypothetical protein
VKAFRILIIAVAVASVGYLAFAACPTVFYSGAETGDRSEWSGYISTNGASVVASDSNVFRGSCVFEGRSAASGASNGKVTKGLASAPEEFRFGYALAPWTFDGSGVSTVLELRKKGSPLPRMGIAIAKLGGGLVPAYGVRITVRDDSRVIATGLVIDTITSGSFHSIDYYAKSGADGDGKAILWIDGGVEFFADTLDSDSIPIDTVLVGIQTVAGSTNSGFILFDACRIDTSGCVVPCGGFRRP